MPMSKEKAPILKKISAICDGAIEIFLFIIAFPQTATWLPNIENAVAVS